MTTVMNIEETPKKSYCAKYYNNKIKTDAEFYEKEKRFPKRALTHDDTPRFSIVYMY
jgi:hypothetical protein